MDFRTKLAVFFCTVFLVSVISKNTVFFCLIGLLAAYGVFQKHYHSIFRCVFVLFIVETIQLISKGNGLGTLLPEMFLFIITRMIAVLISVIPIIKTPPGELTAVINKLKINRNIALSFIFMMRFFPIIGNEFKEIIESLKLRGLFTLTKPLQTMEYVFIPMMFSASKTAEELAAAAEVRGISAAGVHTSKRAIVFTAVDWTITLIALVISAGLYYWELH